MSGSTKQYVDDKVNHRRVMMFAKSTDPDSNKAISILQSYQLPKGKPASLSLSHVIVYTLSLKIPSKLWTSKNVKIVNN